MKALRSHAVVGRRRAGMFGADAILALTMVGALILLLTVAVARQRRAAERLAETRQLIRLAEDALAAAQTGRPAPAAPAGVTIQLRTLADSADAPRGAAWGVVTVARGARSEQLIGLVRRDALQGGAK